MEKGISIFDDWLMSINQRVRASRKLDDTLHIIATEAERFFGIRIWFARVMGRRWSYVAGTKSDQPSRNDRWKSGLDAGIGMTVESWGVLSSQQQERLKVFLNMLVLDKQTTK